MRFGLRNLVTRGKRVKLAVKNGDTWPRHPAAQYKDGP